MSANKLIKVIGRIFFNVLFWLISILAFGFIFRLTETVDRLDVIYSLFFHISIITGVYINFYCIEQLLKKERYAIYLLAFMVNVIGIVFLNFYTFSVLIDYVLPDFYIVNQFGLLETSIISMVYLAITSAIKISRSWVDLQKTKHLMASMEKEKIDNELQSLKSQINPHFLFNSLNVIYSLTLNNDQATPEVVLKLSDILRYVIYDSKQKKVLLSSEVTLLKKYIDLQKYRIEEDALINFSIELEHDPLVAPLIFLTLLENSFKHGIKGDIEDVFIAIKITSDDKKVYFEITNNKADTIKRLENTTGIGLNNVKKRLALEYPNQHKLKISEVDKTFTVYLELAYEI